MFEQIKKRGQISKEMQEMTWEAREIRQNLGLPEMASEEIARSLMLTGLGLLRAHKRQQPRWHSASRTGRG